MTSTDMVVFEYDGNEVAFDPGVTMWNLNAMWKAVGSPKYKSPSDWLRGAQAQELIDALLETAENSRISNTENSRISNYAKVETDVLNVSLSRDNLIQTRRGNSGGTWACPQLAVIYAHYLNPHFYIQWNEWAFAYARQIQTGHAIDPTEFAQLKADVAALKAAQQPSITIRTLNNYAPASPQAWDDLAHAIVSILKAAGVPLGPSHVIAALKENGLGRYAKYSRVRIRMNRMAKRGQIHRLDLGQYIAPDDDDVSLN